MPSSKITLKYELRKLLEDYNFLGTMLNFHFKIVHFL
jgi:hypothetical protein